MHRLFLDLGPEPLMDFKKFIETRGHNAFVGTQLSHAIGHSDRTRAVAVLKCLREEKLIATDKSERPYRHRVIDLEGLLAVLNAAICGNPTKAVGELNTYLDWLESKVRHVDLLGLDRGARDMELGSRFVMPEARSGERRDVDKDDPYRLGQQSSARSVADALTDFPVALISGSAGMGKTTLLKALVQRDIEAARGGGSEARVPVFLRFSDLSNLNDIQESLVLAVSQGKELVRNAVASGRANIYFDSFDEFHGGTGGVATRASLARKLVEWTREMGGNQIRMTSRGEAVDVFKAGWRERCHLALMPLDDTRKGENGRTPMEHLVREYAKLICGLERFSASSEDKVWRRVSEFRRSDSSAREMLGVPLLATLLVVFFAKYKKQPRNRSELYEGICELLFDREPGKASDVPTWEVVSALLSGFCLDAFAGLKGAEWYEGKPGQIARTSLDSYLKSAIPNVLERDKWLKSLAARCPILEFEDNIFRFRHLSIAEYLAAEALVDRDLATTGHGVEVLFSHRTEPRWVNLISLAVGIKALVAPPEAATWIEDGLVCVQDNNVPDVALLAWREARGNPTLDPVFDPDLKLYAWLFAGTICGKNAGLTFDALDRDDPLARLKNLTTLDLNSTQVSELEPLRGLTKLEWLNLDNTQVSELEPLRALTKLTMLGLNNTQVSELKPLMELTELMVLILADTQVRELEPLRVLTKLRTLLLIRTQVSELEPLRGLTELRTLFLSETQVSELEPLRAMTKLTMLDLLNNRLNKGELEWLYKVHHKRRQQCQIHWVPPWSGEE